MGNNLACGGLQRNNEPVLDQPVLEEDDIVGFYDGIMENPVFNERFKTVPLSRVLSMANQILYMLRFSVREGFLMPFEDVLELHLLMNIREEEIDALFTLFIEECHIRSEESWDSYKGILEQVKNLMLESRIADDLNLRFYTEVKRNPILNHRFKGTSPSTLRKITDEVFKMLKNPKPEKQLCSVNDHHRMLNITGQEFDEFFKLYILMYSQDVDFQCQFGPKIARVKEIMIGDIFDKVLKLNTALGTPVIGRKFEIPLDKLQIMSVKMIDMILHSKTVCFEEIVENHKHLEITRDEFKKFNKLFLETCSINDRFVGKARPVFKKLENLMFKSK